MKRKSMKRKSINRKSINRKSINRKTVNMTAINRKCIPFCCICKLYNFVIPSCFKFLIVRNFTIIRIQTIGMNLV